MTSEEVEALYRQQARRLAGWLMRATGDAEAAAGTLERVRETARGGGNLLPPMREALAARCTIGEICGVLREEFGTHDAHLAPR